MSPNAPPDTDKLVIHVNGTASRTSKAERAIMTIQISSETGSKEQSLENITQASNTLQAIAKSLRVEPKDSDALTSGGPLRAPLTDWNMGRLTTHSHLPPDAQRRLALQRNGSAPQPALHQNQQQFGAPEVWTDLGSSEEVETFRRHTAKTEISMKFQDFSVLSSIANKVATTPHAEVINITWYLLDPTREALEKDARKLAVIDAIEKANDLAEPAVGARKAEMTLIESTGGQTNGGGGWSLFGNHGGLFGARNMNMMPQQPQMMQAPGQAGAGQSQPQEELNLEPGRITVSWSVNGQFVA